MVLNVTPLTEANLEFMVMAKTDAGGDINCGDAIDIVKRAYAEGRRTGMVEARDMIVSDGNPEVAIQRITREIKSFRLEVERD